MSKYLGIFALTYHVPVQQTLITNIQQMTGCLISERIYCQQVETTIIKCFVDQIMDERFVMHHSSYMVGWFRRYYGIMSRGNSFTHHPHVVSDIQQ